MRRSNFSTRRVKSVRVEFFWPVSSVCFFFGVLLFFVVLCCSALIVVVNSARLSISVLLLGCQGVQQRPARPTPTAAPSRSRSRSRSPSQTEAKPFIFCRSKVFETGLTVICCRSQSLRNSAGIGLACCLSSYSSSSAGNFQRNAENVAIAGLNRPTGFIGILIS